MGSTIDEQGGCETDVRDRVEDLECCDRYGRQEYQLRFKVKMCKVVKRPVMMFGAETWALRLKEEQSRAREEMRMLRWIKGMSLADRITITAS